MRRCSTFTAVGALMLLVAGHAASGQILGLERVASGLSAPIFVTHAPGDTDRLFIAERGGGIRILDLATGTLLATPFLSLSGVNTSGEGGFLGLAFHPNYCHAGMPGYGKFYVHLTTSGTGGFALTTRIREFEVSADANLANAGSLREILSLGQPQANHNGGWIGFGPDGYLYIAIGDGGGSNDSGTGHTSGTGNAQDITDNLLGKMLRIDVNGDDFPGDATKNYAIPPTNPFVDVTGDDEIWAYGLRNPFRASFDRQTGDLWIGDVGQGAREEIDFQPASSPGGENYGWRLREGLIATPTVGGPCTGCTDPVYDYNRDLDQFGGTVVTGGYIYRGPDPALQGKYFLCDSRNTASTADDNYWTFDPVNPFGTVANIDSLLTVNVGLAQFPVSFGEDAVGNLYIAYIASGEVYRIRTAVTPIAWRSVRTHAGAGALGIALDPSASGDGPGGPGVEPRLGGIQRIEVDLSATVALAAPGNVQVVGRVTSGGVPGPENPYPPASVAMADLNTLAITFDPGALPAEACYTITLGPGTFAAPLAGDTNVRVRALPGDATGNGVVNLTDALAIQARAGAATAADAGFDVDLSGTINVDDALAAKSHVTSPPEEALCP